LWAILTADVRKPKLRFVRRKSVIVSAMMMGARARLGEQEHCVAVSVSKTIAPLVHLRKNGRNQAARANAR